MQFKMIAASHAGKEAGQHIQIPSIHSRPADVTAYWNSSVHPKLPKRSSNDRHALKVAYFFAPLSTTEMH